MLISVSAQIEITFLLSLHKALHQFFDGKNFLTDGFESNNSFALINCIHIIFRRRVNFDFT